MAAHLRRAANSNLVNPARHLTLCTYNRFDVFWIQGSLRRIEIGFRYLTLTSACLLDFCEHFTDCRRKFVFISHTPDVHEHDFGGVPEKMVMKRCHFQAVV